MCGRDAEVRIHDCLSRCRHGWMAVCVATVVRCENDFGSRDHKIDYWTRPEDRRREQLPSSKWSGKTGQPCMAQSLASSWRVAHSVTVTGPSGHLVKKPVA